MPSTPPTSPSIPFVQPFDSHRTRTERPWGWFETLVGGSQTPELAAPAAAGGPALLGPGEQGLAWRYLVKQLWIKPGCRISLQRHRHRCEHWLVLAGSGLLECGDDRLEASAGTSLVVPSGALHRAGAAAAGLLILEVQRGDQLREDDIERIADDYGRVIG